MAESGRHLHGDPVLLADRFALLALALLIAFNLAVLATILPLQLLNVGWQYRFSGALIDNAPVALLGLALIHLAVYLDPDNPHLLSWRRWFGRLALVAALLFAVLIPLQGWVLWQGSSSTSQLQGQQRRFVDREISTLLRSIETARNTPDLIASLPPAVKQSLEPGAERLSLPALRQRLERDVLQARQSLRQQIDRPATADSWILWKRSLRVIASSMVYAMAFSAFVLLPGSELSLWREWQAGWRPWHGLPHRPSADSPDLAYVQSLQEHHDASMDLQAKGTTQSPAVQRKRRPLLSLQLPRSIKAAEQSYFESLASEESPEIPDGRDPS